MGSRPTGPFNIVYCSISFLTIQEILEILDSCNIPLISRAARKHVITLVPDHILTFIVTNCFYLHKDPQDSSQSISFSTFLLST